MNWALCHAACTSTATTKHCQSTLGTSSDEFGKSRARQAPKVVVGTEAAVMEAIDGLHPDLTIFLVAHRLTTLRGCDLIVELERGVIRRIGSYQEIIGDVQRSLPARS